MLKSVEKIISCNNYKEKAINHVIKYCICLLIIYSSNSLYSQKKSDNDDYLIVTKILEKYSDYNDTIYLIEDRESSKHTLLNYYLYKYEGRNSANFVPATKKDSILFSTRKGRKKNDKLNKGLYSVYKPFDSLFSKKEHIAILNESSFFEKWDGSRLNNVIVIQKEKKRTPEDALKNVGKINKRKFINRISKPFYSNDGKYAGVNHVSMMGNYLILFKKVNDDWIEIKRIIPI